MVKHLDASKIIARFFARHLPDIGPIGLIIGTVGMLATRRVRLWDRYGQKMSDAKVAVWFVETRSMRGLHPVTFAIWGLLKSSVVLLEWA